MDLSKISKNLTKDGSGIWTPSRSSSTAPISFPEDGHAACYQIEDDSFWFAHRNECISRALALSPFDGAFLDVGGGNGAVSKRLQADGIETVVLEPGPEGAHNAHARGIATVACATIDQAGFAPSSFGAAGLFDVIEHIQDDEGVLRSVRSVLRRGGVLAVTVPAYEWLWSAEDEEAGHHRRYTLARLRTVLARTGFDVTYATYFFAPLMAPLFVGRSLRYRLGRRASAAVATEAAQHHTPSASARRAIDRVLAFEHGKISAGRSLPFGTSCLAIALAR